MIHKKYKEIFIGLEDQVTCYPAKIIDYVLKTESEEYLELKISKDLNELELETFDTTGLKIWTYIGHIFVSDELKNKIEMMKENDLFFNLGLSVFAA